MVVKEKVGRKRYIIILNSPIIMDLIKKLRKKVGIDVKFIKTIGNFSIIRVRHTEKDKLIENLRKENIITIKTTGTIKKAKKIIRNYSGMKTL